MKSDVFWMVAGSGPTTFRHPTEASAVIEACRLARKYPGKAFYVMQAVSGHIKTDVQRIELVAHVPSDEDLPF